jgi:hypothetical protein
MFDVTKLVQVSNGWNIPLGDVHSQYTFYWSLLH